jgi:2-polyprenyl-3-methyl-5-hydroxy-6-metoxy-1,4-benzoquinol methylase
VAVCDRAPAGLIADVGCGHGLVTALLVAGRSDRTVIGVDPDPKKISLARLGPGRLANVSFRPGTVETLLSDLQGKLDGVVVVDVIYLIPPEEWRGFLESCRRLLKPGGVLLLKEAEANSSWKTWKCLAQEQLMVRILRRTRSSGSVHLITREEVKRLLADTGLEEIEVTDLSKGYTTPHILFTAKCRLR